MKVALVGYGKMGRLLHTILVDRGHHVVAKVDPVAEGARRHLNPKKLGDAEAAFEFTQGDAAAGNVRALLEAGVNVVCGTTGWDPDPAALRRWSSSGGTAVVAAPNFSIGMLFFQKLIEDAAIAFSSTGLYDPYVLELHHRAKLDSPSGTAARLAGKVAGAYGTPVVVGNQAGRVPVGAVHVASIRAGQETGTHAVGFEGAFDSVTLTHRARSREGFAFGAVLVAEWLQGRKGVFDMDAILDRMLAGARKKGGYK